jgi:ornithine carbamoyltransferase
LIRILDSADRWRDGRTTTTERPLAGKSVALVFEKASTRTHVSLEVAVAELGGHPVTVNGVTSQMARGEPIADTARVLSRMVHAMTFRTTSQSRLHEMTAHSSIPVLNALTDQSHPMQLLADLQTVRHVRGKLSGLKYAWIGDGNNVAQSWIEAAGLLGLRLDVACPEGYEPDPQVLGRALELGAEVRIVRDPTAAADAADVISTDVFTSMGQESEREERLQAFKNFRVNQALLARANAEVVVLHCLPAHRGEEIDADVIDGPRSFVWEQAEARLHTAKAALVWALERDG